MRVRKQMNHETENCVVTGFVPRKKKTSSDKITVLFMEQILGKHVPEKKNRVKWAVFPKTSPYFNYLHSSVRINDLKSDD